MKMVRPFLLIGFTTLLLTDCAQAAPEPTLPHRFEPIGTYVHRGSGMAFPDKLSGMNRTAITEYDANADDISAGYNLRARDAAASITVYVYPYPTVVSIGSPPEVVKMARDKVCSDHFAGVKRDIEQAHDNARLIEEGPVPAPDSNYSGQGWRARYTFTSNFAGQERPLVSEADVYCFVGGKWTIAYRTTAPAEYDYRPLLRNVMTDLRWPETHDN